ncbi:chaperonin, 10 kDa [Wolbachia endosymbiont of Armadillidium vulgare str. wVulC]|nr:co-chaperone GroES [Wolbachia endosymbiont of Armadillidium vulgare]KLT22872.1 chaperonin, 10 kDa [Wolbachia endosymbiont of Armadillidium vulgare str. wVulC]OJH30415.1 10 kDa chaperonin [Armadillidium vulgare] [Wolbachia endosymbiont of Armadillidium vulgare]OJH31653.1 10 kDa chaperonin [Wolbachia endosymbiont of Armadillidium vulgare]OJH32062.1 10 kDa chaperonin [Wolbachia endosymbiont of Armadillidium vulgare]OJH32619.1 10 kDa chaperonin [Wolbachia endosymbiont of Armadillidium vulgare]
MSNVNLSVLDDSVLVKPINEEKQGGIVLPSSAEKKPTKGEIIAIGSGSRNSSGERVALTVKAGDKIFYRQWAGTEVEHDNEKYIVMKESDILAVIK